MIRHLVERCLGPVLAGRMFHRHLLTLAIASALLACNSAPSESTGCVAGLSLVCSCANGQTGAQVCRPDRTFDVCVCAGVSTTTDGGIRTDGGTVSTRTDGGTV